MQASRKTEDLTEEPKPRRTLQFLLIGLAMAGAFVVLGTVIMKKSAESPGPRVAVEMPATTMDQLAQPANNSPTLLADPGDPRFVALANRLDAPDFSCALQVSGDGGRTWVSANPVPKLPVGAEKCYAPEVAFDRRGTLYYLFVGLAGPGNRPMGAFLTHSEDRARTFSVPRQVLGPLNFSVRMVIDSDSRTKERVHLVWLKATSDPSLGGFGPPPNPIMAAYSDDGGKTFSQSVQVNSPKRQRVVAPALALGEGGDVLIAYYDLKDDAVDYLGLAGAVWEKEWGIVVSKSSDRGETYNEEVEAEPEVVPHERVMLIFTMAPPALVSHQGRSCIGWPDARNLDSDVFARCSKDQGANWEKAVRVNDDRRGNGRSQLMPKLSVAPGGRIDAIFYDRRNDPGNLFNEVYYSRSSDNGRSFGTNLKLTRDPSFSEVGQRYVNESARGKYEFGSRLGLISHERSSLAAWTDTRNSRSRTPEQDIFTTLIELPSSRLSSIALPSGVALLAIGLLGFTTAAILRNRGRLKGRRVQSIS